MAETLLSKFLRPELEKVAKRMVSNLQNSLKKRGLINKENLFHSIKYKVTVRSASDFNISFSWLSYGDALNFGADVGYLSQAGQKRLEDWVMRKKNVQRRNARRIAFAIQKNWVRSGRFPSVKSRGRGWASTAFRSRDIADLKKVTESALTVAFQKFTDQKVREQFKRGR